MGVRQTQPWARWPSGDHWTIGILFATPSELKAQAGVVFETLKGDLGPFELAVIDEEQVGQLWLVAVHASPEPGTDVRVDLGVTRDEAMRALWRTTGLDVRAFKWVNPYPAHPWSHRLGHAFGVPELNLTLRESQILELLAEGTEPPAIAGSLGIAESTLRGHLSKLRLKFQVQDNAQLKRAIRLSRPARPGLSASA